jgi:hypothetical protein
MHFLPSLFDLPQRVFYTVLASAYLLAAVLTATLGAPSTYYLADAALLGAVAIYGFFCVATNRHFSIWVLPISFAVIAALLIGFHKSMIEGVIFAVFAVFMVSGHFDSARYTRRRPR